MTDADDELRRLRSEGHRVRDENTGLRERLAYCWQHVEHLRARLAEVGRPMRTGEPVDRPGRMPGSLEPVASGRAGRRSHPAPRCQAAAARLSRRRSGEIARPLRSPPTRQWR